MIRRAMFSFPGLYFSNMKFKSHYESPSQLQLQQEAKAIQERARHRWRLLRAGQAEQEEGLRLARQNYAQNPSPSSVMELGVALLWLRRYGEAWEHFCSVISADPRSGDNDYGMAGVAKWCLGEPQEATAKWRAGLKAKYVRAGRPFYLPLLLYFASALRPEVLNPIEAGKLLQETLTHPKIDLWPGPIVKFVLGRINEDEFQRSCQSTNPVETQRRTRPWSAEFYRSLVRRERVTPLEFKDSMRKLVDTSQPEWQEEGVFTSRVWHEEFFLARYESAN